MFDYNFKLAKFLIKKGANINLVKESKYKRERTLLRVAVKIREIRLIKLLLDKKVEVNALSCK